VVRAQLGAGGRNYPYHREHFRFDSRPSKTPPEFLAAAGGSRGFDASAAFGRPDSVTLGIITNNRKQILKLVRVDEGGPFSYPECKGTLAPPPPPGSNRPSPDTACPKQDENYLTVAFPIRGQPEDLKKLPTPGGQAVELTGDVWTAIVDEAHAGRGGQNWFQHAWLFTRNASTGRLELARTIILAWVE
jgi:hypothetical protein